MAPSSRRPSFVSKCPNDSDYSFRDGMLGYGYYLDEPCQLRSESVKSENNKTISAVNDTQLQEATKSVLAEPEEEDLDVDQVVQKLVSKLENLINVRSERENLSDSETVDIKNKLNEQIDNILQFGDSAAMLHAKQRAEKKPYCFDMSLFYDEFITQMETFKKELLNGQQELVFPRLWSVSERLVTLREKQLQIQDLYKKVIQNDKHEVDDEGSADFIGTSNHEHEFNMHGMDISKYLVEYAHLLRQTLEDFRYDVSGQELLRNEEFRLRAKDAELLLEEKAQTIVEDAEKQNERFRKQIETYKDHANAHEHAYTKFLEQKSIDDQASEERKLEYTNQIALLIQKYKDEINETRERCEKAAEMELACELSKKLHTDYKHDYTNAIQLNETFIKAMCVAYPRTQTYTDADADSHTHAHIDTDTQLHTDIPTDSDIQTNTPTHTDAPPRILMNAYTQKFQMFADEHEHKWCEVVKDNLKNIRHVRSEIKNTSEVYNLLYSYLLTYKQQKILECRDAVRVANNNAALFSSGGNVEAYNAERWRVEALKKADKTISSQITILKDYMTDMKRVIEDCNKCLNETIENANTPLKLHDLLSDDYMQAMLTGRCDLASFADKSQDYIIPEMDSNFDESHNAFKSVIPKHCNSYYESLHFSRLLQSWFQVPESDCASVVTVMSEMVEPEN